MTTRYQSLRSSISGNLPAAGTRLPGELWVNFPDLQMGLIDASKTAQRLVAVRYFSTTATYAAGDVVVQAGAIYVANGAVPPGAFTAAQWTKVSTAADLAGYLALAGGTMIGPIVWVTGNSINGAAGTARSLFGTTALSKRWELQLGGPSAEGGANAGSNFNLIAYTDAGAVLSTPMSITRATGAVTFGSSVTIPSLTLAALDSTPIGQTTPAAGSFTALTATSLNGGPLAGQRNRIISGDMRIDQRHAGAAVSALGTGSTYLVDRWAYTATQAGKFNAGQNLSGGGGAAGFPNTIGLTVASAYTTAATDYGILTQTIEGFNISDLQWGTAGAQAVTLSFWVYCTVAGTHSGALVNGAGTLAYAFTFSVPTASVWTKISLTIPGPTTGSWASDNSPGLSVRFNLGSGANFLGTAGNWSAGNWIGATGAVNLAATASAYFYITGVQLEPGTIATPFERRLYGTEFALCQRYYQRYTATAGNVQIIGYNGAGNNVGLTFPIPPMRVLPTSSIIGTWSTINCNGPNIAVGATNAIVLYTTATALGAVTALAPANGGFDLSAEF